MAIHEEGRITPLPHGDNRGLLEFKAPRLNFNLMNSTMGRDNQLQSHIAICPSRGRSQGICWRDPLDEHVLGCVFGDSY
jgi:hypothetical protein